MVDKTIILCADDYAQNPAISQGIIQLIVRQRLSATSCLVTSPDWFEHAHWLKPYKNQISIGLHFNLTQGNPLSNMPFTAPIGVFPSLTQLLISAQLRKINYTEIYNELNCQLDAFEAAMGCLPDFMDGHQHIHCFPVIRQAFLDCYEKRLRKNNSWVRNINPAHLIQLLHSPAPLKKLILYLVGGNALQRELIQHNIPHNSSFAGVYDFKNADQYEQLFAHFFQAIGNDGLIMCHPGLESKDDSDPINTSREKEYQYFSSEKFSIIYKNMLKNLLF